MERSLKEIARKVTPTHEFLTEAKLVSNDVFEKLKACPDLSVARVLIGGSVGKKTAVDGNLFDVDFDLVLFVNKKTPDEKEEAILEICKGQLTKIKGFNSSKPINRNLLQFSLPVTLGGQTTRVEFDLVIATNFGDDEQVTYTMMEIREDFSRDKIARLGPSMSFQLVKVMKELINSKESTRDVVRLAKFWDKTLKKRNKKWGYVKGRSFMIELVATAASRDAKDNSLYEGFIQFLKMMDRFNNIDVKFTEDVKSTESYKVSRIPKEIREGPRPIVMDPVNYCDNVAKGIDPRDIQRYQSYALKTLRFIYLNPNYPLTVENFHEIIGFKGKSQ